MKKILLLLISFYSVAVMGQNLIAPITISLPANPPANTANWATAMPPFMITAQSKLRNGQVPGEVIESRVLVTIKNGGSKICGSYTQQTAPRSNFNTVTKNWNGGVALTLLGQDCTLPPGTYELCVQFYNLNPAAGNGVLGEACKTFTIADTKPQSYSPPQNIIPVNGKVFTQQEANLPITLRWTPVLPKPKADVNYKVRIIEVLPGQNKAAAIRNSAPVEILEVKNLTQANSKLSKRCNGCEYVWNVEASKTPAQGDIEMLGTSETTDFSVKAEVKNDTTNSVPPTYSPPQNVTPADGKVFTKEEAIQPMIFRWTPVVPKPKADVIYKIRLFEIRPGQSKIQALKENQPIEQATVKNTTQTTFKLAQRTNGIVWNVEAVSAERIQGGEPDNYGSSTATTFSVGGGSCGTATMTIDTVMCLGIDMNGASRYRIKVTYSNPATNTCPILLNDPNNKTKNIQANILSNIFCWQDATLTTYYPFLTTSVITPVLAYPFAGMPASITPGNSVTIAAEFVTSSASITVWGFGLWQDGLETTLHPDAANMILTKNLQPCICKECDFVQIQVPQDQPVMQNGLISLSTTIGTTPKKVKRVSATIDYYNVSPTMLNCFVCNNQSALWGSINAATISGNDFTTSSQTGDQIVWDNMGSASLAAPRNLDFKITIPEIVACCGADIKFCIIYKITYEDCTVCQKRVCYSLTKTGCTPQN